jgi:bla regulator protein BlaR1
MNFVQGILLERIINALGWTILHSLWQVLLIGALMSLFCFFFRNHNASIRYNISVFSLVCILGLSVLTFYLYVRPEYRADYANGNPGILISDNFRQIASGGSGNNNSEITFIHVVQKVLDTLQLYFPLITGIWLFGVLIISARMAGGIFYLRKLRHSGLLIIPENVLNRFKNLARLMNIRRIPMFYESSLINVPSVLGYVKPMILLPVSALAQIPVEQLEAIVAHELAHIRRHDWLVNLFQSIIEALYFYHPVVWYIQSSIRKERENCCDDIALKYSGGHLVYVKALASINEISVTQGFPLLAINSEKNYLLNRVLRILKKGKMKTNLKDKLLAGILLASAAVIILLNTGGRFISFNSMPVIQTDTSTAVLQDEKMMTSVNINIAPAVLPVIQTDVKPVIHVAISDLVIPVIDPLPDVSTDDTTLRIKDNVIQRTIIKDGKEMDMKLRVEKGKVIGLTINGNKIPEKDWGKYQADIDETLADVREMEEDLNEAHAYLDQENMEKIRMEIEKSVQEAQEKIKEIDIEAIVQKLENIQPPEIDEEKLKQEIDQAMQEIKEIDFEKISEEMEFEMQSLYEEMKKIELPDAEQLKQEMEKARQELEKIDQEKIQFEVQEAMKEIQINKEELKREIEKSIQEMKEIDIEKINREFEDGKMKMEEMLKEIEKLELDKK